MTIAGHLKEDDLVKERSGYEVAVLDDTIIVSFFTVLGEDRFQLILRKNEATLLRDDLSEAIRELGH